MRINLRMNSKTDRDLISLCLSPTFSFKNFMEISLIKFGNREEYKCKIPNIVNLSKMTLKDIYRTSISINNQEEIVNIINSLEAGLTNPFIKAVLRGSIENNLASAFLPEVNIVKSEKKNKSEVSQPKTSVNKPVKEVVEKKDEQIEELNISANVNKNNNEDFKDVQQSAAESEDDGFDVFGAIDMMLS